MKPSWVSFALIMVFATSGGAQGQQAVSTDGVVEIYPAAVREYHECIMRHWQPPSISIGREDQTVELHIFRTRNGSIRKVEVAGKVRLRDDAIFRGTAESAIRAVGNFRCNDSLPRSGPRGIILYLDPSDLAG